MRNGSINADFSVADDLLREAVEGRLVDHGPVEIAKSGRIGPLVEIARASLSHEDQYRQISVGSEFFHHLRRSLQTRRSFGGDFGARAGAFPLGVANPVTSNEPLWDQWAAHAENITKAQGINASLVAGLLGALIELQDNIYEHSGAPQTGLIAFAVTRHSFEFVVADAGIGVLRSLQQNSEYSHVLDEGAAIELAITDGVSRFPAETGHGQGFRQLFRSLVGHRAELRLRSGDHALSLNPGDSPTTGRATLSQVPRLNGFSISVFCNVGMSS